MAAYNFNFERQCIYVSSFSYQILYSSEALSWICFCHQALYRLEMAAWTMASSTMVDVPARLGHAHLSHLPQRPPINLNFQDLTYTVQNGKSKYIADSAQIQLSPYLTL